MEKINLLLAHADRRASNRIEAMVLDVCYNQAAVHCARTGRVDGLLRHGSCEGFDLIIVAAHHLEASRRAVWAPIGEVARAIEAISRYHPTPVIAIGVPPEDEFLLRQAGVEIVLGHPFDLDELKAEVRRVLGIGELTEKPEPSRGRWSFAGNLLRGFLS